MDCPSFPSNRDSSLIHCFPLEHLQGIPSTETPGNWEPAMSGQKNEIFFKKSALWSGGNGQLMFIVQVNPGSLGVGLFSITPHNGTSVSKRQGWPSMPSLQEGLCIWGWGRWKWALSNPRVLYFLHTRLCWTVEGTLKCVWGKEFKATY